MSIIKHLHILFAVLTAVGFVVRGVWRLQDSPRLRQRWVKVFPHINDTLLFTTGLTMLVVYRWWPFDQPWLATKLTLVLVYIGLGALALRGRTAKVRVAAWVSALLVLAYVFFLALRKTPLPLAAF